MPNFHSLDPAEAFEELGSSRDGLIETEVEERRARYGRNEIPERRRSRLRAFLALR